MGRASDLTIRGVFLPWSDWNIEGPPYVDLPLEERAQLVFSTLFGNGPNGNRAVPVLSDGSLAVGFTSAFVNSPTAVMPPNRRGQTAFVWTAVGLAAGASASYVAPAGQFIVTSVTASVTLAQPIAVFVSFDWGVTYSTNLIQNITSLTTSSALAYGGGATAYKFTNNAASAANIQIVGATSPN